MVLKYWVGIQRGITGLMGRTSSLALFGSRPRDGVSIKTPCSKELRPATLCCKERIIMVQTRSTRVKAPANTRFQNRALLTSRKSYDVPTLTPTGRFSTDASPVKKSPKLINTNSHISITSFNSCTLSKDFYLNELLNSIEKFDLQIVCIQEHRLLHPEPIKYHKLSSEFTFITSSASLNNSNASIGGVGVVPVSYTHLTLPTNREV